MTDFPLQPDGDPTRGDHEEEFVPSLDDPELRQIEAELANRLIAQPALLDRGKILHQAGWEAALAAKQEVERQAEEQQTAASSMIALSGLGFRDSRLADVLNWSGATATVAAVGIAVVLFIKSPVETTSIENSIADVPTIANDDTVADTVVIDENQEVNLSESDNSATVASSQEEQRYENTYEADQSSRPIYRAGAGGFTPGEIESLLSGRPRARAKSSTTLQDSPIKDRQQRSNRLDSNRTEPTAFNLMREWATHAPPKKKSSDL